MGPGDLEYRRTTDLIRSLLFFEPNISQLLVIADGDEWPRGFPEIDFPSPCRVVILQHPRPNNPLNMLGGLCTAVLTALRYAQTYGAGDFVIKLDADSLVIGPFAEKLSMRLQGRPGIGTIGTLGTSCNRATRSSHLDAVVAERLIAALHIGLSNTMPSQADLTFLASLGIAAGVDDAAFRKLCRLLAPIINRPFSGVHCQGGAYAVSGEMLSRLKVAGIFDDPSLWLNLRLGEDQMMGILSGLVELDVADYSGTGDVFGVQSRGLPFSPQELIEYGYSIVHSIKNNQNHDEADLRQFFAGFRQQGERAEAFVP